MPKKKVETPENIDAALVEVDNVPDVERPETSEQIEALQDSGTEQLPAADALVAVEYMEQPPVEDMPVAVEMADEAEPQSQGEQPQAEEKKSFYNLDFHALDRGLSAEQRQEWNDIYASYRSRSILSGNVIGVDQTNFKVQDMDTREMKKVAMNSVIVIAFRVKVLIPETEMWMPGEERPLHVLRSLIGGKIDYVIMEVDREGECAVASRQMALMVKRNYFGHGSHQAGDVLKCNVLTVGPKRCLVECNGFDIGLNHQQLSYAAIADLRQKYHPGEELPCKLLGFDADAGKLEISAKEMQPNPFIGAEQRHPVGCRRQAVISGKYGGGVFCTLPDDTVCLCLYSRQHQDANFCIGDTVIVTIQKYDMARQLTYGRIRARKW